MPASPRSSMILLIVLLKWLLYILLVRNCSAFFPGRSFDQKSRTQTLTLGAKNKIDRRTAQRISSTMGLFVSSFAQVAPKPNDSKESKKERAIAWHKIQQKFEAQVLNPGYFQYPIRARTMEIASEYVPADSDGPATLMPGSHKHLGGAYDPADGCIYGVPATSQNILVLYPKLKGKDDDNNDPRKLIFNIHHSPNFDPSQLTYGMTSIPLPETVKGTKFKWLRGIFHDGYLYAIPAWAPAVLRVDVDTFWGRRNRQEQQQGSSKQEDEQGVVKLIPLPNEHVQSQWQWHGGSLNKLKTAIYCIPSNARHVLKLDLATQETSLLPIHADPKKYPNFRIDLSNKWYGGILGEDDAVYGVPYRSCAVLRIDCATDKVSLVGPDYGMSGYNWHGGIQRNGKIYAHPSHANYTVLQIDTNLQGKCTELPIVRGPDDKDTRTNYKWLGGSVGADGHIYCPACDVNSVLKINVITDECITFGDAGDLKNKYQGGVLGKDGCVYCIPASGHHVLRIATLPDRPNDLQLLGNLPKHKDKWQGGHLGLDGNLYFIPENGYRVLKIKTPQHPPKFTPDGKLPLGDVVVEMM